MSNEPDVECVRKGEYLVIHNSNVALHESEDRILGIVVQIQGEWVLVVPTTPTKDMLAAAKEYNYDLPFQLDTKQVASELQNLHNEINNLQRKLSDLDHIKNRIEKLQSLVLE